MGTQVLPAHPRSESYRHRGLDDDDRGRIHLTYGFNDRLNRTGVEVVAPRVVVGWRRDDDELGSGVRRLRIRGGGQVEGAAREVVGELWVDQGRLPPVDHVHPSLVEVHRPHPVVLGEDNGVGQAHVPEAGNGDLHAGHVRAGG